MRDLVHRTRPLWSRYADPARVLPHFRERSYNRSNPYTDPWDIYFMARWLETCVETV